MILRLLGPVDLRTPDGVVLREVLGQSKRLALLAYLAAARPTGFHSRDTLLGLLWPEFDQGHARAALRQAVYVLRRALGGDVLIGCGDSVLGVDERKLWCDVNAFHQAIDSGELGTALSLYRGELLEGFHVPDSPGFERWVDRMRASLAASAATAAWKLADAEEAKGDYGRALHWMLLILAVRPDDEPALCRAVSFLDKVGDRAAAIRLYDEFSRRIREDYGLEPSIQTRRLIATVRAGSRDSSQTESAPIERSATSYPRTA
jgi:DNA-binding SARP family transcriptional activator